MADLQPRSVDYNLIKPNFTAGELSPRMVGRIDLEKYSAGQDTLENWMIYPQGGVYRRPGMRYVATVKYPATSQGTHLIPFRFSAVQNYVLEMGNLYARFYRNGGQIQVTGTPVEIVTPYADSDTTLIKWTQSADTLYLAHQTYHPQKITRTSDTVWTITRIDFKDGPYLDPNPVSTALLSPASTANPAGKTITGAANNGAGLIRVTCVAHGFGGGATIKIQTVLGTTEANGYWTINPIDADHFDLNTSAFVHAYTSGGTATLLPILTASGTNKNGSAFQPFLVGAAVSGGQLPNSGGGHVGASWRFSSGGTNFGWGIVVAVMSATQAVIDIQTAFDATPASSFWREGAWSGVRGYPACTTIKDQRLVWANTITEPQKMWASRVNDYENHIPQFVAGTTSDSDTWVYRLGTQLVNPIMWMLDSSRGLLVGTTGEEQIGSGAGGSGPITPNSVYFRPQTSYGSLNTVLPVRVGFETLFVTRTGLKLRSASYNLIQDVFIAPDRTLWSEHISWLNMASPGFRHMTYAQEPYSDIYLSRNDGQLAILTYLPEENIMGWSRQTMEGGLAAVESLAAIPATSLATDTVWVVVKRTVNGVDTRSIEYFDPSVNTDSAITSDGVQSSAITLSQMAPGTGVTVTSPDAIFSVGNVGQELVALPKPSGRYYPIPGYVIPVPVGTPPVTQSGGSGRATITAFVNNKSVTVTITEAFANTTVHAGEWGFGSFSFTGLTTLIGKEVNVVGVRFGSVYPNVVVDGTGKVTIPAGHPSIVSVEIGLPFTSTLVTMRPDPKSGGETIQSDRKRWAKIKIRVQETSVLIVDGTEMTARDFTMAAGVGPATYTGDLLLPNASTNDFDGRITISQPNPVFTTIHALFGRLDVGPI